MSLKKNGIFAIKLFITGAILAFLFSLVDTKLVLDHIRAVPFWIFLIAIGGYFGALFFNTLRWSLLLSAFGIFFPLQRLLAYNASWLFYTTALPGGKIAAEAIRIYQVLVDTKDSTLSREKMVIASLMDRVIAILALAFVAIPFFIIMQDALTAGLSSWVSYAAVCGLLLITAFGLVPIEMLVRPFARFLPPAVNSIVSSLGGAINAYRARPALCVYTFALSLLANMALAGGLCAVLSSFGIFIPFLTLFAIFSLGMLTTVIPLTAGGIGLKEGALVYLLVHISGATLEEALSASLIMLGASLSVVAIGGVIELYRHFIRTST